MKKNINVIQLPFAVNVEKNFKYIFQNILNFIFTYIVYYATILNKN